MSQELATARLIDGWDLSAGGTVHRRLAALLAAIDGPADGHDRRGVDPLGVDTLGERNRRLLQLHRDLIGTPLEARVTCGRCGADSEFVVPVDAILDLPLPERGALVRLGAGRRRFTFRLARMADLDAAADAESPRDVRRAIVERCRIGGSAGEVPEPVIHRLAARFEALDPAANIVVNVNCSGCAMPLAASVDVAGFVAGGLDRLVERLLGEVHTIAGTYGWDEARILGLPDWRRRRYVDMIAARASGSPAVAAGGR